MRRTVSLPETLEAFRVTQHLPPLLGQRGELSGELLLSRHTDGENLFGFLPSRRPAEGRQAKRDSGRIRQLAHAMVLGHPEERFDRVRTDRQAEVSQPEALACFKLVLETDAQLQAHRS